MDILNNLSTADVIVFLVVFFIVYYIFKRQKNLPPGPFSLPILGTLPWLGADVREPLEELKKKYGDVFTVYLGSKPSVMLCSQEAIKEAFVKCGHAFSGRPQDLFFIRELTFGRGDCVCMILLILLTCKNIS